MHPNWWHLLIELLAVDLHSGESLGVPCGS